MDPWEVAMVSAISAVAASSGFWSYLMARQGKKSATTRLLMGLANDKISYLGMGYILKGAISKDEYDDLRQYLYEPYVELGGNGTAERIMIEVSKLPFRQHKEDG